MPEQVVIRCPSCAQKYRVAPTVVGHRARCAKCRSSFVVGNQTTFDEDLIVAWISEGDPASESVMGSTGLFQPPEPATPEVPHPAPPAPARQAGTSASLDENEPTVRLARIDEEGAHFEFPVSALAKVDLRASFPHKCVGCGTRHGLEVHLLYWPDRMRSQDAVHWKDFQNTPVGEWERFSHEPPQGWMDQLPSPRHSVLPFSERFPFLTCRHCHASQEIQGKVLPRGTVEVCMLLVRSLATAVEFYRNNGGRHTPEYQRLIEERNLHHDRRNELNPEVRNRLSHWFSPLPGEEFVHYFPDSEFSPAESGNAGAVLTVRRLIFKKFAAYRDYSLTQSCRVEIKSNGPHATVQIFEEGHRPAVLALSDANANQLVFSLRNLNCHWSIVR